MKLADKTYHRAPVNLDGLDFRLPEDLHASEPAEARGMGRDDVRLMVSRPGAGVRHTVFRDLTDELEAGDVLVVNTSPTANASLPATREDGTDVELHLSTGLPAGLWTVEVRDVSPQGTQPLLGAEAGEELRLPAGASATLLAPYAGASGGVRLWVARLEVSEPLAGYLERYGAPIRYGYVEQEWPSEYYQTVFASGVRAGGIGSAEMPSAGRPFTPELVARLVSKGVQFAPITLHTGVSSQEDDEPPYEERFEVSPVAASVVNGAKSRGGRVVAVGTTAVRAVESASFGGMVTATRGWTDLVVTPQRGVDVIDGIVTGLHEPRSSHLAMLEAIAGREDLEVAYTEALTEGYLWHEFGDSHLILRR